jgi:hypothetical protein
MPTTRHWFLAVSAIAILARAQEQYSEAQRDRDYRQCRTNLKNIHVALEMFSCDHRGRFPDRLEDLTLAYLADLPVCPSAGYPTYRYNVGPLGPREECQQGFVERVPGDLVVRLRCQGHHHPDFPPDTPAYTR